jgi:hypothetical protein
MLAISCDGGDVLACVNEVHATACFKLAKIKLSLAGTYHKTAPKVINECTILLKDFLIL